MKGFGVRKLFVFIILAASVALAYQIPYLRYTFYDQMMDALQLNDTQIGLLYSTIALVNTICYPIGGFLAEKLPIRVLIAVSMIGVGVISIIQTLTTDFVLLMVIFVLYGFFTIATLWSAYLAGVRSLADEKNQSKIFGSNEATRGIIQTVMGFVFVAVMGTAASNAAGYKSVIMVGAFVSIAVGVIAFFVLPKGKAGASQDAGAETEKFSFKQVITNKGVWITIIIIMGAYVSWTLCNNYMTTYTVRILNISETTASTLGVVRSYIIVFVAGFLGGFILDKFSNKGKGFIVFLCIAIAGTVGVMASSVVVPLCIALTLIMAFIANVMKSTYWSVMGQAGVPIGMTAVATGIISFIAFIPDFIVPTVCGVWLDDAAAAGNLNDGFVKIFILMIAFAVVGILGSIWLLKTVNKTKAAVTENK